MVWNHTWNCRWYEDEISSTMLDGRWSWEWIVRDGRRMVGEQIDYSGRWKVDGLGWIDVDGTTFIAESWFSAGFQCSNMKQHGNYFVSYNSDKNLRGRSSIFVVPSFAASNHSDWSWIELRWPWDGCMHEIFSVKAFHRHCIPIFLSIHLIYRHRLLGWYKLIIRPRSSVWSDINTSTIIYHLVISCWMICLLPTLQISQSLHHRT